jgi:Stress responsive A/B Barrel Domain
LNGPKNKKLPESKNMKKSCFLILILTLLLSSCTSARVTAASNESAPFLHVVHFWLKPDQKSDQARNQLIKGLQGLRASKNVQSVDVRLPAHTPRAIVDNSYDVQLVVTFIDLASHEAYQSKTDEVHMKFISENAHLWQRVLIYDSLPGQ